MTAQIIAIAVSTCFLLFILELTRKEKIREAYSLLWFGLGLVFLLFSVWRELLDHFGRLVGIAYSPTALILVMIMGVILILIQFSVVISYQSTKIKQLSQELAILSARVKKDNNSSEHSPQQPN